MKEEFAIPGVGGIIVKYEQGKEFILIQDREKEGPQQENGLIEIPAGKIRAFENIFDCLRREIFEETGYEVEYISGEQESTIVNGHDYKVISYEPFCSSQNLTGYYPIMVQVFLCRVKPDTNTHAGSSESKNIRWIGKEELRQKLDNSHQFYPMHISALKKFCQK